MRIPFAQIDAFASAPFTGNPAAVMPLAAWPDDAVLQAIAGTLDFKDSFKNALVEGDRDRLLAMIRDPDRTRNVEFIPWMDSLRSHSNELHDMALPITGAALPQLSGVYGNKLMGALFSDRAVLEELREARLLEDDTDLDVICKKNKKIPNICLSEKSYSLINRHTNRLFSCDIHFPDHQAQFSGASWRSAVWS